MSAIFSSSVIWLRSLSTRASPVTTGTVFCATNVAPVRIKEVRRIAIANRRKLLLLLHRSLAVRSVIFTPGSEARSPFISSSFPWRASERTWARAASPVLRPVSVASARVWRAWIFLALLLGPLPVVLGAARQARLPPRRLSLSSLLSVQALRPRFRPELRRQPSRRVPASALVAVAAVAERTASETSGFPYANATFRRAGA